MQTVTITINRPLRARVLGLTIRGQHRPLVDAYLFVRAVTDRLGVTGSRCPYCGDAIACRWPWQGLADHECGR